MLCHYGPDMKAMALAPNMTPFTDRIGIGETKLNKAHPADIFVDRGCNF